MNYELGLETLKNHAQGTAWYQDFAIQEQRLRENLLDERRYGPDEGSRQMRARIVGELNAMALKYVGIPFNDFCGDRISSNVVTKYDTQNIQKEQYIPTDEEI